MGTVKMVGLPPRKLESRAFWDFPAIVDEFREKQFTLLWRGSRDGFGADDFHRLCNGHPNTLTVILNTEGNLVGGFTPVEWESGPEKRKDDPSLKSFLFTLKNPHNISARRFSLKAEKKDKAISCYSDGGPCFCGGVIVKDDCNANADGYTRYFGYNYTNDTRLDGETFFTGSEKFQVKEIEVFEITE
jgi:hypothetical protein